MIEPPPPEPVYGPGIVRATRILFPCEVSRAHVPETSMSIHPAKPVCVRRQSHERKGAINDQEAYDLTPAGERYE
jgi:hypothetical protein